MWEYIPLIFVLIFVLILVVTINASRKKNKSLNALTQKAGDILGFKFKRGHLMSAPLAVGTINGIKVSLRSMAVTDGNNNNIRLFRIWINHRLGIKGILLVSRENDTTSWEKKFDGEDVQTGDESFDRAMLINGSSQHHISALFSESIRGRILALVAKSLDINLTSSWFEVHLNENTSTAELIAEAAREAAEISGYLTSITDFRAALVDIIHHDSVPGVRAVSIRRLAAHYPMDAEIISLFHTCLKDTSPEVRFAAALHSGNEGLACMTDMLNKPGLAGRHLEMEMIAFLGKSAYAPAIPALIRYFESIMSKKAHLAVLESCAAIESPELNEFLLRNLERDDSDIRNKAIDALGSCGTAASVEPLINLAKSSINPLLRSAVQKTIARIQSRLGGVDAGWLSVAGLDGAEGGLSISDSAGEGALSGDKE